MKGKNRSNPLLPPLPPPYPPPPSLSSLLPSSSPLPTSPEQQNLPPDPFNLLNTWLSPFNIIGANPFGGNGQLIQKLGMLDLANILSQPYTLIQATVPLFPTFRPDDSRSTRRNSAFDNDISAENNIERANIFNVNNQNKDSADALNDSANAPKTDESNPPMLSAETVCPTCSGSFEDPKLAIFCNECQKWIHKKCCSKHFAKEEGLKKGRGNKDPDNEGGSEKEKGKKSTTNKKEKKDNNKGLDEDDNEKENEEMEEVEKEPYPIVTRSSLKRKHEQDQKKDTQINRRVHFNNYNRTRRSQDNNSRRSLSLSRSRTNRGRMTRKSGYRAENEDDDKGDSGSSSEDETQIMRPGSPQRPMLSPILSSSSSPSPELGPKEAPLQLEHLPILTQQAGPGQTLAQQTPVEPMPPLKQANRTTSTSPNTSAPNKSGPASSSTINIEPPETDADSSTDTAITFCSIDMSILACDMCTICGTCGTLYQDIISCVDCGQSFHVECIHYTGPLFYGYTWRCPECSICEKCGKHCTTADSVACATCSCLYHASCIGTTLVPWFWECDACKMMKVLKQQQNPAQAVAASVGLPVGTPPVGQLDDECYSGDEEMTIEEEAFEERTENVPCPSDTRTCIICGGKEEADDRLLFVECDTWAHTQCTLLSDGVTVSDTNKIYGLKETIEANKMTKCSLCGKTGGVTVSCYTKKCPKRYHPKCAIASGGTVFKNKRIPKKLYSFFCEPHMRKISRLMYVEPVPIPTISRSRGIPKIVVLHKKSLRKFPARLGNFSVISIGLNPRRYLKKSFDSDIRAYPMYRLGWRSMLLFWDYKNPKEKCLYRCEIVQNIKVPVKEATCKNLVAKVTVIRNGLESDTFVAPSTSEIWCKIIELINSARGPEKLHFKGGDYYFGFTNSLVLETVYYININIILLLFIFIPISILFYIIFILY